MKRHWFAHRVSGFSKKFSLALFFLPLVFASSAAATPLFTWSFVAPTGFVQPDASIPLDISITNTGSSAILGLSGTSIDDTFTNSSYGFTFNSSLFLGVDVQPGQTSGPLLLGTYTPKAIPVASGTYSILLDSFTNLSLNDGSGSTTEVPSNGFQRTVRPGSEFTWGFVQPSGPFGTGSSIPVDYVITNTGDTTITNLTGLSEDDTFTPSPYSFSFSPSSFLGSLDLAPGQTSAPQLFGTFTPNGTVLPGSYSILNDQFTNITLNDGTGANTIQTSNTFAATVITPVPSTVTPEPSTFTMGSLALVAMMIRRTLRRA